MAVTSNVRSFFDEYKEWKEIVLITDIKLFLKTLLINKIRKCAQCQ